jgi:hypothetical protein
MVTLKKALNVANILNQKIERIPFKGEMYQAFKEPQNKGVWFVWGASASGKSTFLLQLAKEFAKTEDTFYNLLEEETDDSDFIERNEIVGTSDVKDNFLASSYDYEQMCTYLDKRGSPDVVFIDSGIYFFKSFEQYLEFKRKYRKKIIVISGHAQGSNPRSELEKSIMFDAKQKVFVTGYLAACKGRTIGPNGGLYTIWEEGYKKLRGEHQQD